MTPSLRFLHRTIRQRVSWLLLALLGLVGTVQAQTTIRYVKPAASGNGSGSSWTNASNDLQAMIDASSSGQQVWVARGTYQPATNSSFAMKDEVAIYGGFAGTEGSLTDRPVVNPNAGQPSGSVLRGNGNRVITNPSRLDRMARLDGFVITGGYALKGGGLYNSVSSPTIANCSFLNNTASKGYTFPDGKLVQGGGMYNENSSSPAIINCLFKDNTSIDGGGMYNFMSSSPRLTNCSFISNSVFTNGGALDNYNSSPTLINCSFQSNEATNGSGGGIYNTLISRPGLTNCSFQGNVTGAAGTGGAIYNENNSGATLANGVVFGNGGANTFSSDGTSAVTASYTLFELSVTGYTNGGHNLTTATSPFASSTDTQLNGCTTALNAGSDLAYLQVNGTATDLAAQPRKYNNGPGTPDRIDMGAYEYQADPSQISVTNPSVSTATVGAVFSQAFTASGGASPYSYSVVSSSLPASLTLSRAGVLSGTPTEAGSYSVLVKTQDTYGCTATATTAYSLTVSLSTTIRYVKPGGSGTGNSWADASGNLQSQIDFVNAQQVWVARGTYRPGAGSSFSMKNGVAIYGGFVGTESSLSDRPPVNPITGGPNAARPASSTLVGNGKSVIRNPAGLTSTARLDGFLITGGNALNSFGGGMYNTGSSPALTNCSFQSNTATYGGGIYNQNSSPALTNCLFQGNTVDYDGGGMANNSSSYPVLTNCLFRNNTAGYGGGMHNSGSSPALTNCLFQGNTADYSGGGVFDESSSSPGLINCSFQGNSATNGGGMYNLSGNVVLTNCVLFGNGGGNTFYNVFGGLVSASYCLFEASATDYIDGDHNLTTTASPFASTTSAQLNGCSPAINTGSNDVYRTAGGPATDLAGNARRYNNGPGTPDRIDMGAYEYQANPASISVSNPSVSTATVGAAFSQSFTASGGSSPYSYSVVNGSLPTGLSLSGAGVLSGTPTQAGSYSVLVQASDASGCVEVSTIYALTVRGATPTITRFMADDRTVCAGDLVSFTATVGNTTGSYSFTLTNGTSSISATSSTAAFSQTLTASGSVNQSFTLTVSSNGQVATATAPLTANALPIASLTNNGPISCPMPSVRLTASGGTSYTFTSADGTVLVGSGNTRSVSTAGTYSVRVANNSGCVSTTSTSVLSSTATISVSNPTVSTATVGQPFRQSFTASGGTAPYSFSAMSSNLPASLSLSRTGVLSGTPTVTGSYSVLVQASDANGCTGTDSTAYSLTVSEPVSPIRYVKQGGIGSGNSWADASGDLQSQINIEGTQQVWVAAGTYQPAAGSSFVMQNAALYGGFVGNESRLDQRPAINPLANQPNAARFSGSVLRGNGNSVITRASSLLDGFVITGGSADYGGGMFNEGGSPTIANCIFQGNSAGSGGGMFNLLSSPRLINCSFLNNSANSGGGMANNSSSYPVLINCSFQGNSAGSGGGMNNYFGSGASLTNCVVFGNGGNNTFSGSYGGYVSASYSLFDASATGYADGGNNLTTATSPFVSTTSTQLNGCAPALNTGNNDAYTSANGPATDLAGNARIYPGGGQIDMGAYEYQASPTTITITNPSVSTATVGQPFSQSFTASGGMGSYSYSVVSGNLPASLSLSTSGVLAGTPTVAASYSVLVQAQDASGCSGVSTSYTLMVSDATPTLIGFSTSPGTVCAGSPVTFTATVGNVTGSYSYTLTNGIGTPTGSTTTGSATGNAFSQVLTASGSASQSFTLTVSANGQSATATTPLTVNALPIPSLSAAPSATLTCAQTSLTLTADGSTGGSGSLYTFSTNVVSRSENRAVINTTGIYSVTVTNTSGCSGTSSLTIYSNATLLTPTLLASNGGVLTCALTSLALTAGGSGDTGAMFAYAFAGPGVISQAGNQAIVSASGLYSVTVTNTASGCFSTTTIGVTSTTAIVSVTNPAQTMTALGTPFSQPFTASGGVSPYSFSLASGSLPTGLTLSTTGVLSGSATQQGSFPFTVSATDANGCTGTGVVYTLSIPSTQFTVLARDPENGNLYTNTLKPYLLLQNDGNAPIAYGELTVRYWLTVENNVPLRFDINYAQMGNDKVHFTYVPLNPARQGASGYIEFSFDASAGSLAPMSNAVIQDLVNKQDYSMFFQGDDYSYVNNANFAPNPHITAYRNGVLVYGTEPGGITDGPAALSLTATANPVMILTTGATTLSAMASGGTSPYSYVFTGPGTIQTNGNTAMVSNLPAGVQTFTVAATDMSQPTAQVVSTTVSVTVTAPVPVNTPPVAIANANQTATQDQNFTYQTNAFSDNETPTMLTYTASIVPANGFSFTPATRMIQGIPQNTGVSSVTITATDPGGLSANTVFTITVSPAPVVGSTQLTVLSRDPDNGQLSTNTLKPYLQLQNDGSTGIPYSEITVRYWLTVENPAPLRFDINYAQMGNNNVHLTYVPISPARQGATGYIEFSFDAAAGSLGAGSNAVIQDLINKQDYSYFNQGDDYSYVNTGNFTANPRITAYRNGVLIYGTEPPVGARLGVEDATESLQVRVLGNPVHGSELTVEVRGAASQSLGLRVTDLNGHLVSEQRVERAGVVEQQRLGIGQASAGLLFLQVSTPTQSRTVKVLKVN